MSYTVFKHYALGLFMLVALLAAVPGQADDVTATITKRLQQARPDFTITSVQPSPVAGVYEVQLVGGPLIYATADGEYFFLGDLFDVQEGGLVNLAELKRNEERSQLLAEVKIEDMVVFSPEGETRAWIAVFTDVDCFYCQKLHKEVPELNRRGIEVRYLAYPRAGVGSDSYRKIASAWCADDPRQAITDLKNHLEIPDNVCADNPVASQFALGQQIGVRGTPAMVTADGTMIPGYIEAAELAARIGVK